MEEIWLIAVVRWSMCCAPSTSCFRGIAPGFFIVLNSVSVHELRSGKARSNQRAFSVGSVGAGASGNPAPSPLLCVLLIKHLLTGSSPPRRQGARSEEHT